MDFNNATAPVIPEREEFKISTGDIVLFGVRAILPVKTELDQYASAEDMFASDVAERVPWLAGVSLRLIALRVRDGDGVVRGMYQQDAAGNIILPFGHKGLTYYYRVTESQLTQGWIRKYTGDKRRITMSRPDNFADYSPMQRYAFWRDVAGATLGFEPGQLSQGSTFYAYFTWNKSKNNKWYSDIKKVYKDEKTENWMDTCPREIGSVDPGLLTRIDEIVGGAFETAKTDETSFNYGSNAPAEDGYDRIAGF